MTNCNSAGGKSVNGPTADPARGASGEGANSALEAMLRKRKMDVHQHADQAVTVRPGQLDGSKAKE